MSKVANSSNRGHARDYDKQPNVLDNNFDSKDENAVRTSDDTGDELEVIAVMKTMELS